MLGMVTDTNTGDYEVWENQRSRTPPIDPDFASVASLQTRAQRMIEEERGSRDTLSFERQRPPNTEQDGSLMPPVPESRDYSGIEDRQMEIQRLRQVRQDLRSMARRHPAPTPPYTETDIASINRPRNDSPRLSSFTPPAMSPARQPPTGETSASTSPRRPLDEDNTYRGPSFHDVSTLLWSQVQGN